MNNDINAGFIHANYTIVLKTLIDMNIDFGLKDYPLYESTTNSPFIPTREQLNEKILNHFKYREIGFETPARFIDELNIRMNEIMPKYNYLMKSLDLTYNPLDNVDYMRTYQGSSNGTDVSSSTGNNASNSSNDSTTHATTTGTNESTGKSVSSDTPQNNININDIDSVTYANNVSHNKQNDSSSDESNATNTGTTETTSNSTLSGQTNSENQDQHEEHLKGNYGVKSSQALIQEYRDIVTNYEMDICNDLNDLFMLVY